MAGLIGAVTLNLALDITYRVDRLEVGASHRVDQVRQRAGGKGVNVARVALALGHPALALGFAGGRTGELIAADLDSTGVPALLTPIAGESRRSVAVVDSADATVFNEAGPSVSADEWRAFRDRLPWRRLGLLVCAGSLPPGLQTDAYAELAALARHHGVDTVVDTSGPALLSAAKAGALVRANASEVRAALGVEDLVAGGKQLLELGATAAVLTDGPAGLVAITPDGCWRGRPVEAVSGNPTGAGDACTAVVAALASTGDWPGLVRAAVAGSSAAVLTPVAGDIDLPAYHRWLPRVTVTPC